MRPLLSILLLALSGGLLGPASADPAAGAPTAPITVGVVPQQATAKMVRAWGPILRYLEQGTGQRFEFQTAPDIPAFEARLAAGAYDIAYMNPYHYTVVHEAVGYQAFAKARDKRIRGILVVRRDSPVGTLSQLQDAELAFPAPAAFAASLLPRGSLARQGIAIRPVYVASHDSVYRAVARGLYPAGGGVMRTFNALDPALREQLRILWVTPGFTPHALAAHPRLDPQLLGRIQQLLVRMDGDRAGRPLLEPLKLKGFAAAKDSDWDDVRRLGLTERLGDR